MSAFLRPSSVFETRREDQSGLRRRFSTHMDIQFSDLRWCSSRSSVVPVKASFSVRFLFFFKHYAVRNLFAYCSGVLLQKNKQGMQKNVETEERCGLVVTIRAQSKLSVTTFTPFCIRNTFCFNAVDTDSGYAIVYGAHLID